MEGLLREMVEERIEYVVDVVGVLGKLAGT
jgi:hypothetical protein